MNVVTYCERFQQVLRLITNIFFAEVIEHCCTITSATLGETLTNIAKDMDTFSYRLPLGVTAGITPFNFPAMIPLWVIFLIIPH